MRLFNRKSTEVVPNGARGEDWLQDEACDQTAEFGRGESCLEAGQHVPTGSRLGLVLFGLLNAVRRCSAARRTRKAAAVMTRLVAVPPMP